MIWIYAIGAIIGFALGWLYVAHDSPRPFTEWQGYRIGLTLGLLWPLALLALLVMIPVKLLSPRNTHPAA